MQENGNTAVFMTDSISEALAIGGRIAVPGRPATPAYDVGAPRTGTRALRDRPEFCAKLNFLKRINLICPVQSHLQKYFASRLTQIRSISSAVLSLRGALAIVTNVGAGCGGRGSVLRAT
jgi:hypothetical protein